MTNRLLSQLNRRLGRRGETVTLRRYTGTGAGRVATDLDLPAFVKGLAAAQLIGGITTQSYQVILSPTPIIADGWPHMTSPPAPASQVIDPASIARLPVASDKVLIHSVERAISRVVPIFDSGVCVRIELTAAG